MAFERPDRALSRDIVEVFLEEIASPKQLMDLGDFWKRLYYVRVWVQS